MLSRSVTSMLRSRASTLCAHAVDSAKAAAMTIAGAKVPTSRLGLGGKVGEKRFPGGAPALRAEQLAPQHDRGPGPLGKPRLGLDAAEQPGERRRIADREITGIAAPEQADGAVDPR